MTPEEISMLLNGVYRIYWGDDGGGYSVASIGRNQNGDVWFAPANWIGGLVSFNWKIVARVELIEKSPY